MKHAIPLIAAAPATTAAIPLPEDHRPDSNVARVIYAEAGPNCSRLERFYVYSVIANRRNHAGFGNGQLKTLFDVAYQPGAFTCIGDSRNRNWTDPDFRSDAWTEALALSRGYAVPRAGIVYYHDKSIARPPRNWTNRYWSVFPVLETKHFIFYGVRPR